MAKGNRFIHVSNTGYLGNIMEDVYTGVCYIGSVNTGITPLLDSHGDVIVHDRAHSIEIDLVGGINDSTECIVVIEGQKVRIKIPNKKAKMYSKIQVSIPGKPDESETFMFWNVRYQNKVRKEYEEFLGYTIPDSNIYEWF